MRINVEKSRAVRVALAAANGPASAHTITSAVDVQFAAYRAEQALRGKGIPERLWKGARVKYAPAGPGMAYAQKGYKVATTEVVVKRGVSAWFLVDARRIDKWADAPEVFEIRVPREAYDIAVEKYMQGFVCG